MASRLLDSSIVSDMCRSAIQWTLIGVAFLMKGI